MLISEFKSKCIQSLKHVKDTGNPLVVTLRGEPIVTVYPYSESEGEIRLGSLVQGALIPDGIENLTFDENWESIE